MKTNLLRNQKISGILRRKNLETKTSALLEEVVISAAVTLNQFIESKNIPLINQLASNLRAYMLDIFEDFYKKQNAYSINSRAYDLMITADYRVKEILYRWGTGSTGIPASVKINAADIDIFITAFNLTEHEACRMSEESWFRLAELNNIFTDPRRTSNDQKIRLYLGGYKECINENTVQQIINCDVLPDWLTPNPHLYALRHALHEKNLFDIKARRLGESHAILTVPSNEITEPLCTVFRKFINAEKFTYTDFICFSLLSQPELQTDDLQYQYAAIDKINSITELCAAINKNNLTLFKRDADGKTDGFNSHSTPLDFIKYYTTLTKVNRYSVERLEKMSAFILSNYAEISKRNGFKPRALIELITNVFVECEERLKDGTQRYSSDLQLAIYDMDLPNVFSLFMTLIKDPNCEISQDDVLSHLRKIVCSGPSSFRVALLNSGFSIDEHELEMLILHSINSAVFKHNPVHHFDMTLKALSIYEARIPGFFSKLQGQYVHTSDMDLASRAYFYSLKNEIENTLKSGILEDIKRRAPTASIDDVGSNRYIEKRF